MATKKTAKPVAKKTAAKKITAKKIVTKVMEKKSDAKPDLLNPYYNPILMLQEFLKFEAAGGAILIICAALAMIVANSPLAHTYHEILHETKAVVGIGPLMVEKDIIHWINDGLMAIFFFLVGLEIKREVMEGMLSTKEQLILPIVAAIGGMVVPGFVYYFINSGAENPLALNGWAIPTATDIAFALGVLSVLGKRVPIALKVFLLALAIIDDLGAIVIIAIFYTQNLDVGNLMTAGVFIAGLVALNKLNVSKGSWYLMFGVALWICVLKSGVHATLAGVITAFAIPLQTEGERRSLLRQLEHDLHSFIAFIVLPIFAFANAGINLDGVGMSDIKSTVALGVIAGLVIGKPIGITAFTWAFTKMGIAKLPKGMTIGHVAAVSALGGIGFTMSIFIATLGFKGTDPTMAIFLREAKIGILLGSVFAAFIGLGILWFTCRKNKSIDQDQEAIELNPNK
ncbi:MAG: NhaA family Na+:H+ antiporter [Alphaproteobacteria bacterium]|jgi:NhaA family Na+:H+ antiporter